MPYVAPPSAAAPFLASNPVFGPGFGIEGVGFEFPNFDLSSFKDWFLSPPGGSAASDVGPSFTGGATGQEPGVLGLPEETEDKRMGFLDDIFGAIERAIPIAQSVGLLPGPSPVIINAGGAGQTGIPNVTLASGGMPVGLDIPGIDLQLPFRRETAARVGAMRIAGTCPGLFHTTPSGQRRANRVSLAADETGTMGFFVDAGRPTAWSKVSLKKSRPRHHHHRPY